jgi:hypothetical protein|nr:MAG TPA: hypothetical protein [Caudoviricetes sp.]
MIILVVLAVVILAEAAGLIIYKIGEAQNYIRPCGRKRK